MTTDPLSRQQASEQTLALYIHVPFCEQKCAYCDFFTITDPHREHPLIDGWLDTCLEELRLWRRDYPEIEGRRISSLFFGGGTPSLLAPSAFDRFIAGIAAEWNLEPDAEISLETQPGTLAGQDFSAMVRAGINRFSIGVQTFNEGLLEPTRRAHTVGDAIACLGWARETAADVSLDLICALPGQTPEQWLGDLDRALEFDPHHISAYEMTYHAGTDYYRQLRRGQIAEPGDDIRAEMFRATRRLLVAAGLEHYEISNYAKPGHESRHNRTYWTLGSFVGLGAGAHGFLQAPGGAGRRFMNPRSAGDYARAVDEGRLFAKPHDSTDADIALVENLQMVLRLTSGANLDWLAERVGQDIRVTRARQLAKLVERGWIEVSGGRIRLSEDGQLFADSVAESLL